MFGNFFRRVDQDRFKKRHVERLPSCVRFRAITFIEHAASYPYLHLAIDLVQPGLREIQTIAWPTVTSALDQSP
jgi:hypothetical protein